MQKLNDYSQSSAQSFIENYDMAYFPIVKGSLGNGSFNNVKSVKLAQVIHDMTQHIWSISISLQYENNTCECKGFLAPFPHHKLHVFVQNYVARPLNSFEDIQHMLNSALDMSKKLVKGELGIKSVLRAYNNGIPLTIGTGWNKHAVEVTISKISPTEQYLIYTNKGERGDKTQHSITAPESGMIVYRAKNKLTSEVVHHLINLHYSEHKSFSHEQKCFLEGSGAQSMRALLGLKLVAEKNIVPQSVPNCSWVNSKGGVRALIILDLMKKAKTLNPALPDFQAFSEVDLVADQRYKHFSDFLKEEDLGHFLSLKELFNHEQSAYTQENYTKILLEISTKLSFPKNKYYAERQVKRAEMREMIRSTLATSPIPLELMVARDKNPRILEHLISGSFFISVDAQDVRQVQYKNDQDEIVTFTLPEEMTTSTHLMNSYPFLRLPLGFAMLTKIESANQSSIAITKSVFKTKDECEQYLRDRHAGSMAFLPTPEGYYYLIKISQDDNFTGFVNSHECLNKAILKVRSHQNLFNLLRDRGIAFESKEQALTHLSTRTHVLYRHEHAYRVLTQNKDVELELIKAKYGGLLASWEKATSGKHARKWNFWKK